MGVGGYPGQEGKKRPQLIPLGRMKRRKNAGVAHSCVSLNARIGEMNQAPPRRSSFVFTTIMYS